ncbi:ABC-2 type transport system ATP-binding protein [Entomoplasma freundtii]|uniref:ABC transporter ATP-binding protein n=1 Tax=Entomoplasma freundtii TaxID=74700 RepID=A0A2K8NRU4_9MOLU|nr:ABC transporter ATP-binding protein [Entomoplasma freundtii]ATZ16484.1 ABC transporter ATP-binding protein [Entomoplasma freundtii]TDY56013.1 ABC-2 type transport system ATP-binding protein [Entomoplasma freundtii]
MKLEIRNLTKSIKQKVILENINLAFETGKYYGFLGNNGAGKTTLLKCIFNEYEYQKGLITLDGQKIAANDFNKMYYFSDNNDLPKNISIYEFLQTQYLFNKGNLTCFDLCLLEKNDYFKNLDLKKTTIGSLSSGQQKMVSLLACKILDPQIIFFDEPTTNLDISNKELIINEIQKINISNKIIVIITHLVEEFSNLFDEIIILNNKSIAYQGSTTGDVKAKFLEIINHREVVENA